MSRLFDALGRFTVRFRYPIVVAWVIVAILAVRLLPSLADVASDTTQGLLPAGAPSGQAAALAAPFGDSSASSAIVVFERDGGLTAADNALVDGLETGVRGVPHVTAVVDVGRSTDGEAREALVEADVVTFSGPAAAQAVVDGIRAQLASAHAPAGLTVHLTGQLASQVDATTSGGSSRNDTQLVSVLFIALLLLVAFRAFLAPLLTLLPAGLALLVAGPVIAEATRAGIQVSSITQLLLVVLVLGAGTDYGVFLVFRVREELREGATTQEAVARAVSRVGESITFSALTVIAALVSLVIAEFGIYRAIGPALAIGIAVMLLAGLTLLPALLAIAGRAAFWPSRLTHPSTANAGVWERIGRITTRRPLQTLLMGVVLFAALSASLVTTGVAGFAQATDSAPGTDAAVGATVLRQHFPFSTAGRSSVLLAYPTSVWTDPSVLQRAQDALAGLAEFGQVVGPLDPNGRPMTIVQLEQLHGQLGPAAGLPAVPVDASVPLDLYGAYRATAQSISADGRTIQYSVEFEVNAPASPAALAAVTTARSDIAAIATSTGAVSSGFVGQLALAADISDVSGHDLGRLIPVVAVLIGLLLAVLLRSLVAPLYLVASICLSYAAALGVTAIVFVKLGGQDGISFILPFLLFVFLMALGSDYNILIMSRIREEARTRPLPEAVARAIGRTGSTVTTAGVVLGGTFAVLAIVGARTGGAQIQQIGYGVAVGILMDTFLVRSLFVPSLVVLLGRWNWWPSRVHAAGPASKDRVAGEPLADVGQAS